MRKLQKAAVVALMVGSAGMLGAGVASAHDEPGGDFTVRNPQLLNCEYSGNTFTAPVSASTAVAGDASLSQVYGNTCLQTGPSFTAGGDED